MIYVYKMWDFHNGYWITDSPEKREEIDDSDDWYWMDEDTYKEHVDSVPSSGNLAEYGIEPR